jgi:hypothetical protein
MIRSHILGFGRSVEAHLAFDRSASQFVGGPGELDVNLFFGDRIGQRDPVNFFWGWFHGRGVGLYMESDMEIQFFGRSVFCKSLILQVWRREWDSNPRILADLRFSRPVQ